MKNKPVLVFWIDACFEEGWVDVDDVKDEAFASSDDLIVQSIGFFIKEDRDNLFLCMSHDDDGAVSDVLIIPKKMIVSKIYLMEPKNVLRKM